MLKIDEDMIVRCGQRFGHMHVYINEDADGNIRETISRCIKETTSIPYTLHYIKRTPKHYSLLIGDKVGTPPVCGTLGGFVRKIPHSIGTSTVESLQAIVSRHVAIHCNSTDNMMQIGEIIRGVIQLPHTDRVDVAAVCLKGFTKDYVNLKFKDPHGRLTTRCRYVYTNDTISKNIHRFRLVFLRGVTTELGHGELYNVTLEYANLQVPTLLLKSRLDKPDTPLCAPGDSGALVCSMDTDGVVWALAILVGEVLPSTEPKTFYAQMLQEGLIELGEKHDANYEFVG